MKKIITFILLVLDLMIFGAIGAQAASFYPPYNSTPPSYGQIPVGNSSGTYTLTATTSLGITGGGGSSASSTLLSDNNTWTGGNIFGNSTTTSFSATTASSSNMTVSNVLTVGANGSAKFLFASGGGTQCATFNNSGQLQGTGSACGAGSSGLSSYDAFTHPATGQSATTSLMLLYGNASTSQLTATTSITVGQTAFAFGVFLNGQASVGSSTPAAMFSISTTTNPVEPFLLIASSTTAGATTTIVDVDAQGHVTLNAGNGLPKISSCGTGSPSVTAGSNDTVGDFTTGTSASACTITFGQPYSITPEVFITDSNTSAVVDVSSRSTTGFTISLASALSADNVSYLVIMP